MLNVLNKSEDEESLELDLSAFEVSDGEYGGYIMCADSLTAMNTRGKEQISEYENTVCVRGKILKTAVRKLSFAEYVIRLT